MLCKFATDLRESPGLVIVDAKVGNDAVTSSPVKVPEDMEGKAADGGRGGEPAGPSLCQVGDREPALRPASVVETGIKGESVSFRHSQSPADAFQQLDVM